jgi:N-acetyl-gamma-glutamyl-phosphate reductase
VLPAAHGDEPSLRLLPPGEAPALPSARGSNFCDLGDLVDERHGTSIVLATLDNLDKGASGQLVQCLNVMMGWDERAGLLEAPLVP